jgi:hypothetical protein
LYQFTKRVTKVNCNNYREISQLSTSYKCPSLKVKTTYSLNYWIISVGFNVTDQLLIRFSAFTRYWRKNVGVQWGSTSNIHILQESLRVSGEGSNVLGIHKLSQAD